MDQWNLRSTAQFTQQATQGGSAQYSYTTGYAQQQQQQQPQQQQQQASGAPYNQQAYLQQAVVPQGGYGTQTYAGVWQQQRAPQQQQGEQSQAAYGNRQLASASGASANQYAGQFGGVYGVTQQQLLGVPSKGSEYQASGGSRSTNAYGGGVQDRPVGSGASYVAGGVNVSGGYGGDSSKYLTNAGYGKAVDYGAASQYNNQKPSVDPYISTSSYPKPDNYASQVYEQLQQVARVSANVGYGTGGADASGLLASLGATQGMAGGSLAPQPTSAYGGARGMTSVQAYPTSPTMGYVSLPPGRDYGNSRVSSGGSMFQREGSYGRSERPSIGSSRFDERERHSDREQREREEREREREKERERERERRERERERERERREEERRRERTPPRAKRESPAKRDEKISRRESPRLSHRHSSPSKEKRREYFCKLENLLEPVRNCATISRRYTKLAVAPDFSKFIVSWMGKEDKIQLEKPISFEHESVDVEEDAETNETTGKSADKPKGSTVWNVKVMLMSGLTEECIGELLSDKAEKLTNSNLHKMLKFVALRKDRSAIMAAGGRWDKSLDGGDPGVDDNVLIRTAVRLLKELVQLDLSECKDWVRFGEIHYERIDSDGWPSHKEISVIFVPDLSGCLPSVENWTLQWNQRKQPKKVALQEAAVSNDKEAEKEGANGLNSETKSETTNNTKEEKKEKDGKEKKEEVPPEPGFVLSAKRTKSSKLRSMTISLDGLLDYDENDKDECTFELSLFAEAFVEMLQFQKGSQILSNLEILRKASLTRKRDDKKRSRQTQNEGEAKKAKTEATKPMTEDASKPEVKEICPEGEESQAKETTDGEVKVQVNPVTPPESEDPAKKERNGNGKKEKSEKKEKKVTVDKELLKAYRYFDKNKSGYVKGEEMRRLLNSLGNNLTARTVKDLVNCGVVESGKPREDKIFYRALTDKEVS